MVVLSGLITLIFAIVMQLKVGRHIPPLPPDKKKNPYGLSVKALFPLLYALTGLLIFLPISIRSEKQNLEKILHFIGSCMDYFLDSRRFFVSQYDQTQFVKLRLKDLF